MSDDEPLYCTWCGAEDYHCDCRKDQDGGRYCESNYVHEWSEDDKDGTARCRCCGLRAVLLEPPDGALRFIEKGNER